MNEDILTSSGNVFADLGFSQEEAAILQMRADLLAHLRNYIQSSRITRTKTAEILGISPSRVSDLMNGKWENFSLELLIALATKAGLRVSLETAA